MHWRDAGAIRSSASDMLMYLQANLHPDRLNLATGSSTAATLPATLIQSHQPRAEGRIALNMAGPQRETIGTMGEPAGCSSYAFFNPKGDFAAIILSNTAPTKSGSFADRLGQHIQGRDWRRNRPSRLPTMERRNRDLKLTYIEAPQQKHRPRRTASSQSLITWPGSTFISPKFMNALQPRNPTL